MLVLGSVTGAAAVLLLGVPSVRLRQSFRAAS